MGSIEVLRTNVCLPAALIDGMEYLGITVAEDDRAAMYRQRNLYLRQMSYHREYDPELPIVKQLFYDGKTSAIDDLGIANYEVVPFGCTVTSAILYTLNDFSNHFNHNDRVLGIVRRREVPHIEHVREIRSDGQVQGNTMIFDRVTFEREALFWINRCGFNAIVLHRKESDNRPGFYKFHGGFW